MRPNYVMGCLMQGVYIMEFFKSHFKNTILYENEFQNPNIFQQTIMHQSFSRAIYFSWVKALILCVVATILSLYKCISYLDASHHFSMSPKRQFKKRCKRQITKKLGKQNQGSKPSSMAHAVKNIDKNLNKPAGIF
jgi:hypothetical protein